MKNNIHKWDLQEIITVLEKRYNEIEEVYLFGSRGYKTNSIRSDIDLLVVRDKSKHCISKAEFVADFSHKYPIVDVFFSYDKLSAESVNNGSELKLRKEYSNLIEQVDAKKLWTRQQGFVDNFEQEWKYQSALRNYNFHMTVIPDYARPIDELIDMNLVILESQKNIKYFFTGSTFKDLSNNIVKIIENSFSMPTTYQKKAKEFSFDKIKINNEYDFQNFIHLILKTIFPDIECEPFMVKIDGNEKKADFSLCNSKVIIEAKWIDSPSKKNEVLKTISGLTDFYQQNPNVQSLIFLLLYDKNINIEEAKINSFSYHKNDKHVIIKAIKNIYM